MDPITILAAFAPALIEAGKAAISRWVAPDQFKPSTVEQYIAMKKADIDLFSAINNAAGSGVTYQWVEAIKQLQRPLVAAIVMMVWADAHGFLISEVAKDTASIDNFASLIGFYLFGDRSLFYITRRGAGTG